MMLQNKIELIETKRTIKLNLTDSAAASKKRGERKTPAGLELQKTQEKHRYHQQCTTAIIQSHTHTHTHTDLLKLTQTSTHRFIKIHSLPFILSFSLNDVASRILQ